MGVHDEVLAALSAHDQADTDRDTAAAGRLAAALSSLDDTRAALDTSNAMVASLRAQMVVTDALVVELRARIAELEAGGPTDPPPTETLFGYYPGGNAAPSAVQSLFGVLPKLHSTYLQQEISEAQVTKLKGWMDAGIHVLATVTTKGTQRIARVADGVTADLAWLDAQVAQIKVLTEYATSRGVSFRVTWDHEWEVKVNQGNLTGASAVATTYGKALSLFFSEVHAAAPQAVTTYWVGGSDKPKISGVLASLTVAPKLVIADPYTTDREPDTQTPATCWGEIIGWLRANSDVIRLGIKRFGLGEAGMSLPHGDPAIATYIGRFVQDAEDLGLEQVLYFGSSGTYDYALSKTGTPTAVPAMTNVLRT